MLCGAEISRGLLHRRLLRSVGADGGAGQEGSRPQGHVGAAVFATRARKNRRHPQPSTASSTGSVRSSSMWNAWVVADGARSLASEPDYKRDIGRRRRANPGPLRSRSSPSSQPFKDRDPCVAFKARNSAGSERCRHSCAENPAASVAADADDADRHEDGGNFIIDPRAHSRRSGAESRYARDEKEVRPRGRPNWFRCVPATGRTIKGGGGQRDGARRWHRAIPT